MKKYQFKTNINCGGCLSVVTPYLNEDPGIKHWNVDTLNPSKILTVETDVLEAPEVKKIIEKAGYKAELL